MKFDLEQLLLDKGIKYKKTNNPNQLLIQCTSGLHVDKDPSLSFDMGKGVFKCWSCDFRGTVTKFLESIGISTKVPLETKIEFKLEKVKKKIQDIRSLEGVRMPAMATPFEASFRNIYESIITDFGAFTTNELGLEDYLCFPVYQYGKLRFIEGRLMGESNNRPKYNRRPSGVNTGDILFPLDRLPKTKKVILVEGIFDMLYLHQLGYINALTIFGTQNFSAKKAQLLDNIGILSVDIALDGDLAGRNATERVKNLLEQRDIKCNSIYLPNGKDLDDLEQYEIKYLLGDPIK